MSTKEALKRANDETRFSNSFYMPRSVKKKEPPQYHFLGNSRNKVESKYLSIKLKKKEKEGGTILLSKVCDQENANGL